MSFRLQWPTQYGVITQGFLERPEYYGQFHYRGLDGLTYALAGHEGIDLRALPGSEIYACAAGQVKEVYLLSEKPFHNYGNYVRIQHDDGYETTYAHLQDVRVVLGAQLAAGDLVGLADSTGNSRAAHLHLTLKKKGATQAGETLFKNDIIDPSPFLDSPLITRPEKQGLRLDKARWFVEEAVRKLEAQDGNAAHEILMHTVIPWFYANAPKHSTSLEHAQAHTAARWHCEEAVRQIEAQALPNAADILLTQVLPWLNSPGPQIIGILSVKSNPKSKSKAKSKTASRKRTVSKPRKTRSSKTSAPKKKPAR